MVMPSLLLQRPTIKTKAKDHARCLERRMNKWIEGDFNALVIEGRTIQKAFQSKNKKKVENVSKTFCNFMLKGKVKNALRLLETCPTSGVVPLNDEVISTLTEKHPEQKEASDDILIEGDPPFIDPVLYDNINESTILKAAIKTKGCAGPSGVDADGWRRILVSRNFGDDGKDLRDALASFARKLCTENMVTKAVLLSPYTASRLIPLDKSPGIRPIGVGEVIRRIVGKAILSVIKPMVVDNAGFQQLCAGQESGTEASIHSLREILDEDDTDGVLFLDASNAFNSINRKAMINNLQHTCPTIANCIRNTYSFPSRLFVQGGVEIESSEGTTQGDPLAMPSYALAILPLLQSLDTKLRRMAFADDFRGSGKLEEIRQWWGYIGSNGPKYGYYPNATKSWLVVKPEFLEEAERLFAGTGINISSEGRPYLGSFINVNDGKSQDDFVENKVKKWIKKIEKLSEIALFQPQAAYLAFTTGLRHKYTYISRTTPNIKEHLIKLDHVINTKFLKAIVINTKFLKAITEQQDLSVNERKLLSLPVSLGGLGIPIFNDLCDVEYVNSTKFSRPLTDAILTCENIVFEDISISNRRVRAEIKRERGERNKTVLQNLQSEMHVEKLRANEISQLKISSSWLTSLPIKEEGFSLSKREFFDALALRYRWNVKHLP